MKSGDIRAFLVGDTFAVAGASRERHKYGNKVLRCYVQHGRKAYPVNPNVDEVEGLTAYPDLAALPEKVHGLSIITQPAITEKLIEQAIQLNISHIWMQPGAESDRAVRVAEDAGLNVIHGGPCLLVVLGYREK